MTYEPTRASVETFMQKVREALRSINHSMQRVRHAFEDFNHPPSVERRWLREHARAEAAEAALWLERHLRNFEREVTGR